MEANITELWQIVESMQLELDSMSMDMDALWLMFGAILVVCESSVNLLKCFLLYRACMRVV